jgi:filamentous hemagglutinin family protein
MFNKVDLLNRQDHNQKLTVQLTVKLIGFLSSLANWYLLNNNPVQAQITPDQTVNTEVNTVNNVTEITGGTKANDNLFHSFQNFSLETGNTAFFNNNLEIKNIISRVTGENISNLDGLIRANGNANLILINPNGINFGSNASLDIGGSFLGSTADSVIFADGTVFSAKDTQTNPLLTISVPLGLQIGQNSGDINVSVYQEKDII